MKGLVFTELLDLIESGHGYETVDSVINSCQLENDGAYTAVGTYDHHDLLKIVGSLSKKLDVEAPDLVKGFGQHLFRKFTVSFSDLISGYDSAFDLLRHVDDIIHVEVRKLWPNAELPKFFCEMEGDSKLIMDYRSARPFADLAEGLIVECIQHYPEKIDLVRFDLSDDGTAARFELTKV